MPQVSPEFDYAGTLQTPKESHRELKDHLLWPDILLDWVVGIPDFKYFLEMKTQPVCQLAEIVDTLQISLQEVRLVIETIASVLFDELDPIVNVKSEEVENVGVDVYDLVLFMYVKSYKRLLPRGHTDSTVVADVWPSTSAFDGFGLRLLRCRKRSFNGTS